MISVTAVEGAALRCLQHYPAIDDQLPHEVERLAELLGKMDFLGLEEIDEQRVDPEALQDLARWSDGGASL